MKIYTRTGDAGTTALVGGTRVSKASLRLDAYGTSDELNSFIGLLLTYPDLTADDRETLLMVQNKIFTRPDAIPDGLDTIHIRRLEQQIDALTETLPPLNCFILPGGTPSAAMANVCRTVCRRAERRVVALSEAATLDPIVGRFLNRLSDYLFTLGRALNHRAGCPETAWQK